MLGVMHMVKKRIKIIVALSVALMLLSGCSVKTTVPENGKKSVAEQLEYDNMERDVSKKDSDETDKSTASKAENDEPAPVEFDTYEAFESTEAFLQETAQSVSTGEELTYVLNKSTKKFHLPTCSSVGQIKDKNREDFNGSRDEVLSRGYVACKRCNP